MPDKRIELAKDMLEKLNRKMERAKGTPKEEELQLQINKVEELIQHLENE